MNICVGKLHPVHDMRCSSLSGRLRAHCDWTPCLRESHVKRCNITTSAGCTLERLNWVLALP